MRQWGDPTAAKNTNPTLLEEIDNKVEVASIFITVEGNVEQVEIVDEYEDPSYTVQ